MILAITRELFRNAKVRLIDESEKIERDIMIYSYLTITSLDNESEKLFQEGLDRTQQNRTSITIAHRLSTIQNPA